LQTGFLKLCRAGSRECPCVHFPSRLVCLAALVLCSAAGITAGQTSSTAPAKTQQPTIRAVNYRRACTTTRIPFRSTDPNQIASGEAEVKNKGSRVEIEAKFTSLEPATRFGLQYLTYVLWRFRRRAAPKISANLR